MVDAAPSETGAITVLLPHQLRERAGGARSIALSAATVREAIRSLDDYHPGLVFSICQETGELRPFVNVFVGQEDVRYLQGLDTPVREGDVVHIIHSVAGGSKDRRKSRNV